MSFYDKPAEIAVTYEFLDQPIIWYLRPYLEAEEKKNRQKFFALTEEKREEQQDQHNVDLIISLMTGPPENLPEFNKDFGQMTDWKDALREFFADENGLKLKLVEDALSVYFMHFQPKEFFRSV